MWSSARISKGGFCHYKGRFDSEPALCFLLIRECADRTVFDEHIRRQSIPRPMDQIERVTGSNRPFTDGFEGQRLARFALLRLARCLVKIRLTMPDHSRVAVGLHQHRSLLVDADPANAARLP